MMQGNAKMPANEFGDALRGPELVRPTMGVGPLAKQLFQTPLLFRRQAGRRTGMRFGGEAVLLLGKLEPAKDGTGMDANDASDILNFVALLNSQNGLAAS